MAAPDAHPQLNSWKEIAGALGVSVRTAQKWEAEFGLPVKRIPGDKGRVSADSGDLKAWHAATIARRRPWNDIPFLRIYALLMTALLLVIIGFEAGSRLWERKSAAPALARVDQNFLVVEDSQGRELWRRVFPTVLPPAAYAERASSGQRWSWFGNLDRDAGVETVFIYHSSNYDPAGDGLICFSQAGREKWRFPVGRSVSDRSGPYSRNYHISSFLVSHLRPDSGPQVLVSSHHVSGYPSQFVLLGQDGRLLGEYWHSGHLQELNVADLDGDGQPEILLAGTDAGYRQATLIALDSKRVFGASSQPAGDIHQLQNLPVAQEKFRVLFPRTCLNQAAEEFNRVTRVTPRDGLLEVAVNALSTCSDCEVVYTFDAHLRLGSVRVSESWQRIHRDMFRRGLIDHPFSPEELPSPQILAGPA